MPPDLVGGHGVVGRQVLGALAGGDDLEAAGARPIKRSRRSTPAGRHRRANRRCLGSRLSGQMRTGEHVGLYVDHDNVPCGAAIALRGHWAITAGGLPVASTMTSTSGSAHASAPTRQNGFGRSAALPSHVRQALRAPIGIEIAMTETSSPAIVGTWFRNIEPNLPAPIRPTRTGFPEAARCLQQAMKVHGLFRRHLAYRGAGVIQQRVVGDRLDRREVAMRDPFRAGRRSDVFRGPRTRSDRRCGAGKA